MMRLILKGLYTKKRGIGQQQVKPLKIPAPDKFPHGYKEYSIFKRQLTVFVNAHNPDKRRELFLLKSLLTGKASMVAETIDFTENEEEKNRIHF
jgi:hypothetical protein